MASKKEPVALDLAKRLFDLPPSSLSPAEVPSWVKAFRQRNFQDKLLRVIQCSGRGIAYYLSQANPKDVLAIKLTVLYKQVSLSRKVFRGGHPVSHLHTSSEHLRALLADPSDDKAAVKAFSFLQWLNFAVFSFWDNMVFLTHPSVGIINRPKSLWWNSSVVRQTSINWRARSDIFAFIGAFLDFLLARQKRDAVRKKVLALPTSTAEADDASSTLDAAETKCRETIYQLVRYSADIATYLPQASWSAAGPWHHTRGWHDGYIGAVGVIASLFTMRSEWKKLK